MPDNKKWKTGDIVYWMHTNGADASVKFGLVDYVYPGIVCADLLEPYERRLVNGIPIDQFQSETRFKKLPKGWTYNTELFQITQAPKDEKFQKFQSLCVNNSEGLKKAYEEGYLVKAEKKFRGEITADITKQGYRIIKRIPAWFMRSDLPPLSVTLEVNKCCHTYEEALEQCKAFRAELQRQASLTDYEWSMEEAEKTVRHWQRLYGKTDDEVRAVLDKLTSFNSFEDIEVRLADGHIQWKYWKNKKWHNITD